MLRRKVLLDLREEEPPSIPLEVVGSPCTKCHGKVFARLDKPSSYDLEDKYLYCPKCGELRPNEGDVHLPAKQ